MNQIIPTYLIPIQQHLFKPNISLENLGVLLRDERLAGLTPTIICDHNMVVNISL